MNANRSSFNSSLSQELCFLTFLRCMIYQDLVVQRKLQILPLNKLFIRSPLNSFYQVKYQGISRGPAGINLSLITVSYTNLSNAITFTDTTLHVANYNHPLTHPCTRHHVRFLASEVRCTLIRTHSMTLFILKQLNVKR